jgi:hypothetical protein
MPVLHAYFACVFLQESSSEEESESELNKNELDKNELDMDEDGPFPAARQYAHA